MSPSYLWHILLLTDTSVLYLSIAFVVDMGVDSVIPRCLFFASPPFVDLTRQTFYPSPPLACVNADRRHLRGRPPLRRLHHRPVSS